MIGYDKELRKFGKALPASISHIWCLPSRYTTAGRICGERTATSNKLIQVKLPFMGQYKNLFPIMMEIERRENNRLVNR
jgi:hypothetical protein